MQPRLPVRWPRHTSSWTDEPQVEEYLGLIKLASKGGQTKISDADYIEGAPELVVEIVGSSRAYNLHQKKRAYLRNGVREYLAWITSERRLLWWELRGGEYREILPTEDGSLRSRVFPGLWLDARSLPAGRNENGAGSISARTSSPEHRAFLEA